MNPRYNFGRFSATVALVTGLLWVGLTAGPAQANDYGRFIEIESEEDLLDLLAAQEIDEDSYETLLEMLSDGVDLNTADRDELYSLPNLTYSDVDAILEYRQDAGTIADPLVLVTANVISQEKLMAIAPFVVVKDADPSMFDTRGRFRYMTTYVGGDEQVPSMALNAKLSTFKYLDIGLWGVLTRNRISDVVFDPNRSSDNGPDSALSARPPSLQIHVPKFYLQWETTNWHLVAGTYRIGFGQRLTFDNTTRYTPNGIRVDDTISYNQDLTRACKEADAELGSSPCTGDAANVYQSPDYRWTDRLRGLAVGLKQASLGDGWLQTYGFFSYQTYSIYQYEIFDRDQCDDPLNDDLDECKAPWVYKRTGDPLAPTSRFSYQTLPDMYNELLGGANVSYFFDRRTHIGVTGYGASIDWLVQGVNLDFQEWSRLPYGGPFGVVGVDAAWGRDRMDIALELSRSFDSQPEGGGFAAILRTTATWKNHEFEGAVRYYDRDFVNPYGRPLAAADEYDGLRARDEAGMRLRYVGKVDDLQIRSLADFWAQLSDEAPKMRFQVRADYAVERWFHPGLWFEFSDKDLSRGGHLDMCYETPFETFEDEPVPCGGEKLQAGVQLRFVPTNRLSVTAKYQHRWLDERKVEGGVDLYGDSYRQDMSAWVVIMYKPIDDLRLRARVRYLNEAIDHDDILEKSLWWYLEAAYWYDRDFRVKLRYEMFSWLDDRASTQGRDPNPAHWLRLELEARF